MKTASLSAPNSVAPIKPRIFACLIDLSVLVLSLLLANFALPRSHANPLAILGVFVSIAIVLGVVVYQIALLSSTGQTIGKRVMGLRIVDFSDSSNPGFARAVLIRCWLPGLLLSIPCLGWVLWVVDNLYVLKEDRRCIHDLMAGTMVVQLATDEHSAMRSV